MQTIQMRKYELALVLTTDAGKDEASATKILKTLLAKVGGKVVSHEILGVKDLAYPIRKVSQGWYGYYQVELDETKVGEVNKLLTIETPVLRYLLVKKD